MSRPLRLNLEALVGTRCGDGEEQDLHGGGEPERDGDSAALYTQTSGVTGTPLEAIVHDITRPAAAGEPGSSPGATANRGGHPYQARPETIRVLKERRRGSRAALAVDFEDTEGRAWSYAYGARQLEDGSWVTEGGAGGGGRPAGSPPPKPPRSQPWANFGGWGCYLGGRVYGEAVELVRFVDGERVVDEDTVETGVALLICEQAPDEGQLELYDGDGQLLATQPWPPGPPLRPRPSA